MSVWPFSVEIRVRFRDCDPMRHVNNAALVTYLEVARTDYWMKARGLSRIGEFDIILAHVDIDFESPAVYGETVVVDLSVARIGNSSFTLAYRLTDKESGRLVAEAQTVQAYFDYESGKARPIPDALRKALEADLR